MISRIFIYFSSFLLTIGCTPSINKSEADLTIEYLSMTHFDSNGYKLYSISSPKSIFIKNKQIYKLGKTEIVIYKENKLDYFINSNKSSLFINNKDIELEGNVILYDTKENANTVSADNAFWNINKSEFNLVGNVNLKNNSINLLSSKALLNKKENIIKFFKPVKYKYFSNSSTFNYKLKSDNAYYDLDKKSLLFESENKRVKSKINF